LYYHQSANRFSTQLHLLATGILQAFDFTSNQINLNDIREKITMFILEQIIDQNGEFHFHEDVSTESDKA
jgi:hypothetical protein